MRVGRRGIGAATATGAAALVLAACSPTAAKSTDGYDASSASPQVTWDAATDFNAANTSAGGKNPTPDADGRPGVWLWGVETPVGSAPTAMGTYQAPASQCMGTTGSPVSWNDTSSAAALVGSTTLAECTDSGGGVFTVDAGQLVAVPTAAGATVVRWTSPISGVVVVAGGLTPADPGDVPSPGATSPPTRSPVTFLLTAGGTMVSSGTTTGGARSFNPADATGYATNTGGPQTGERLVVTAGEVVELIVAQDGAPASGTTDATEVDMTIHSNVGGPQAALPEAAQVWALPVSAALAVGGGLAWHRRRRAGRAH